MVEESFDYVIVGAGSAGCVLAARLTEDGQHSVLLLEYGGSDRSPFIQMPAALSIPMNMPRYNWGYHTEPEPHLGGRRLQTPRGKVLGGSSSINGLVYVRGNPHDFDGWQAQGASGWGYHDVLPYFRRAEHRAAGGDEYRGADGPLATRHGELANPLYHAWLAAGAQAGYPASADPNETNYVMTVILLTILVVYVTMVYGPIAAWLVELFPTRIRYSGMSLPYHIGNGWFGGFLPATAFAIVAATGNIYSGLWYPIGVAAMSFVVGLIFLPETKDRDIRRI